MAATIRRVRVNEARSEMGEGNTGRSEPVSCNIGGLTLALSDFNIASLAPARDDGSDHIS
jgi:hypothetical protein